MNVMERATYDRLSAEFPVVPVARRVPADTETPVSTYLKVAGGPWSFLLESVEGGTRWGRYSLVGFDPFLTVEARGDDTIVRRDGAEEKCTEPMAALRSVLAEHR